MPERGALVLVATPIGNLGDLSPRAVDVLRAVDVIAAEDTRRTRALLTHAGIPGGRRLQSLHGHNERARARDLVELMRKGARVAYVTDAGMPGVSDPGERLVRACVDAGLPVEVVPGPSAALAALVLSGLPTARFAFEGFLPRKGKARSERLAAIAREERTTVVFESPARVGATVADLLAVCGDARRVAIARELTKLHEEVWRGTLSEAVAYFDTKPPRGEYVIVVEPATPQEVADEDVDGAARAALANGATARDAAADIAARLGISKRRAYDAVIAQRRAQ